MIKSIHANSFKGRIFAQGLGKANAIVGANFSGKTTFIQAIQLALLGYVPEVGKTNAATFTLASAPKMAVRLEMTNGHHYERTFIQKADSIKSSFETNDPKPPTEADLPLLVAEAYFGLTESERIDYVFARCAVPDKYTPASILAALERISFGEEHSEEIEVCKTILIADARGFFERAEKESPGMAVKEALTGLTSEKGHLKTEFALWNRRAKDTLGAVRTMMDLRQREAECSAETIAELDAALAGHRSELAAVEQEAGALTARAQQAAATESRRAEIQKILDRGADDISGEIARQEAIFKENSIHAVTTFDGAHLNARKGAAMEIFQSIAQYEAEIAAAKKEALEIEAQLSEIKEASACPFCKCSGTGWKATVEEGARIALDKSRAKRVRLEFSAKNTGEVATAIQEEIAELERQRDAIIQARDACAAAQSALGLLRYHRTNETARIDRLTEELASLATVTAPSAKEREDVFDKRAQITALIQEAEARRTAAVTLQNNLRNAALAEIDHLKACAWVTVIKAVGAKLKEIQAEMLETVFGGLLATANGICGGILKSPLAFHEGGIGRWEGARWIGHKGFSGSERALCYVAVAAALSAQSPFKCLFIDEFGRLDERNQGRVLGQLSALLDAGILDQVIIIATSLMAPEDWTVIRL